MCHQVQVFHIENVRTSPDFISYEAHLRMGNLFDTLPLWVNIPSHRRNEGTNEGTLSVPCLVDYLLTKVQSCTVVRTFIRSVPYFVQYIRRLPSYLRSLQKSRARVRSSLWNHEIWYEGTFYQGTFVDYLRTRLPSYVGTFYLGTFVTFRKTEGERILTLISILCSCILCGNLIQRALE